MKAHSPTRAAYASVAGRARKILVFGRSMSTKEILHVSEVDRGDLCWCVCPECGGDLVAKKGDVRVNHFAHATGMDCAGAWETALHHFAKRIFSQQKSIALPEVARTAILENGQPKCLRPLGPATETFDEVALESKRGGYVADAVGLQGGTETLVEFAVTHFVDEEKAARLAADKLRSVEIDLSGVNTEAHLADIADEILVKAPRKWIWHPKWPTLDVELKAWIAEKNAELRVAQERQQHEEALRRAQEAQRRAEREAEEQRQRTAEEARRKRILAGALADVRAAKNVQVPLSSDFGLAATRRRVKDAYLTTLIGAEFDGDWIVAAHRSDWQAAVVDAFLLLPRRKGKAQHKFSEGSIRNWALGRGWLSSHVLDLAEEDEAVIAREIPGFVAPRGVFRAYLNFLQAEHVIARNSPPHLPDVWWKVDEDFLAET